MSIPHWPKHERPREKLLQKGAQALSDAELLAILMNKGIRGVTAVDLAREWLQQYQSLSKLFTTKFSDLSRLRGMGISTYCHLQAAMELQRRCLQESLQHEEKWVCSTTVKSFLKAHLRHLDHEAFACLFMNTHHRFLAFEILFHGSVSKAFVHPREVVKRSLHHNAAALIAAHNHPSGTTQPSLADRELTSSLKQTLSSVDIRLLDHIIIAAGEEPFSFAERGLM